MRFLFEVLESLAILDSIEIENGTRIRLGNESLAELKELYPE